MSDHETNFLRAVDAFRQRERRFLKMLDYLAVARSLGWRPPTGKASV